MDNGQTEKLRRAKNLNSLVWQLTGNCSDDGLQIFSMFLKANVWSGKTLTRILNSFRPNACLTVIQYFKNSEFVHLWCILLLKKSMLQLKEQWKLLLVHYFNWIWFNILLWYDVIFMLPFKEGRAYGFAAVCRSVGLPAIPVHFLCIGCKYWNKI
jgi:hypothetical protein